MPDKCAVPITIRSVKAFNLINMVVWFQDFCDEPTFVSWNRVNYKIKQRPEKTTSLADDAQNEERQTCKKTTERKSKRHSLTVMPSVDTPLHTEQNYDN